METAVIIWDKIQTGGPPVIICLSLVIWWLARDREALVARITKLQEQKDELGERTRDAIGNAASSIKDLREFLFHNTGGERK